MLFGERVIATLTVQYWDVLQALPNPSLKPKDWEGFLAFLQGNLANALATHMYDEIRYLAEIYQSEGGRQDR